MSDPKHIGAGFDLPPYPYTEAQSQSFKRELEREAERKELEDLGHLKSMAFKAFSGEKGERLKGIADEWSRFNCIRSDQIEGLKMMHKPVLEQLRDALRKAKDRS